MFVNKIEKLPESKNTSKQKNTRNERKLTKYEKSILRPLKIISVGSYIAIILNMTLPVYQNILGFRIIFQWLINLVYIYSIFNSKGYTEEYNISIGKFLCLRIAEYGYSLARKSITINYAIFFILVLYDIFMVAFMAYHKVNYEFEVEKYVK